MAPAATHDGSHALTSPAPAGFAPFVQVQQDDPFDLANLLRIIRTRLWLVLTITIIAFASTAVYTFQLTPVYEANAQLLIEPQKPNVVPTADIYGENLGQATSYYNTQLSLIRSERIARRVLANLGINRMPGQPLAAGKETLVSLINKSTGVSIAKESRIFNVSFSSPDAEFAARAANAVVKEYIDDTRERTQGVSDLGLKQLREKAAEMEPRVQEAQEALRDYLTTSGLTESLGSEAALTAQLSALRSALGQLQVSRQKFESVRDLLAGKPDAALLHPDIQLTSIHEQLRSQLIQAEAQWAKLLATWTESHPEVQKARPHLEYLRSAYAAETARQHERIVLELESVLAQAKEIEKQIHDLEAKINELSGRRAKHVMLSQAANTLRESYEGVQRRIEQIVLTRATSRQDENMFVIEDARAPRMPMWPNIPRNLLLGLCAGLFVGALVAFLLDVLDTTLKSKEDVEKLLGLPVIGFVPRIAKVTRVRVGTRSLKVSAEQLALYDSNSAVAESFRSIRTGLGYVLPADHSRALLVTSATPGDGKSLVASNVAASFAQRGDRVLLVDADMRRPRQSAIMGLEDDEGLSNLLSENGSARGLGAVCVSPVANLDVLSAGPPPHNPAELLGSEAMRAFIERATQVYDWVIFDAPPMNAVADPAIMMGHIQHVLFVVRSFHTRREQALIATEMIRNSAACSASVILNTVDVPTAYHAHPYYGASNHYYRRYQTRARRELVAAVPEGRTDLVVSIAPAHGSPSPAEADGASSEWMALSQAAQLLGLSVADLAQLADRYEWPVRTGRGPRGVTEAHYPIASVKDYLASGA